MTVKEMKKYLEGKDDNAELFFSVWTVDGEVRYRTQLSNKKEGRHQYVGKHGESYLRITWIDDCLADKFFEWDMKLI